MGSHGVNVVIKARDDASRKFKGIGLAAGGMGRALRTAVGMAAGYLGARAMMNFGRSTIAALEAQEQASRKLGQALIATKGAVGLSKEELQKFADQLQKVTTYSDEATEAAMSVMATFKEIKGDHFKAATMLAQDMSTALGQDLQSSVIQLGKALNDPLKGLTALSRVGVSFTEEQKKQIKQFTAQNDVMGAQRVILEELASEFGGQAQAQVKDFTGVLAQLKNTWGDVKEEMGKAIADIPGLIEGLKVAQMMIGTFGTTIKFVWTDIKLGFVSLSATINHHVDIMNQYIGWFLKALWTGFKEMLDTFTVVLENIYNNFVNCIKAMWSWVNGEGFDFEWTGLLDGFERTIEELPKIAKRAMGPIEKALTEELEGLEAKLALQMEEKFSPEKIDIKKFLEGDTGGAGKAATAGGSSKGLRAFESRFMTMAPGATVDKTEINTGRMVKLLEHVERNISILAKKAERAGMTGKQLEMHVTKFA